MNKNKPIVGTAKKTNQPVIKVVEKDQRNWSFSFKYYNQMKHFGLGGISPKWFVSLLEKLKDLSKENIDSFLKDHRTKDANRYHLVKWDAIKIPIKRKNIYWVDKEVIENEEDYPFFQFQISTGLGRIIGFWDENYRFFNIVLLDPKHNLQPSKNYNYKVDNTSIEHSEITSLLMDIDIIKGLNCLIDGCRCKEEINKLPTKLNRGRFVYFQVDEEYYDDFLEKTQNKSIKDLIELGLLSI
jgi:hypothetical protein